ncbi:MAG TPA: prepilin-type N-terminal cleavage/methylation domain-containing protein [Chthoniobacterales bacterium]
MRLGGIGPQGFTLVEMVLALAVGSLMLAAVVAASVCLQKSFAAVDNYFASHLQQVRIIDYLNRDVKRAYIVTSSTDPQTVTCILPNYLVDNGSNQPTRATPMLSLVGNKIVANYQATTVNNVSLTQNSANISCLGLPLISTHFTSSNVGQAIIGTGIPVGATIQSVSGCVLGNCSHATMSNPASLSNPGATVTIGSLTNVVYSVINQTIRRRENGTLTNIAASADNLIPTTSDVELANTEFVQSTVTFLPMFAKGHPGFYDDARAGTAVFSLSYLRNRRRGDN